MAVCALRLHPAVPGSGVRCGRACWGLGSGCAPPLLGEVLGCGCACVPVPLWSPAPPGWGCCAGVCGWAWVAAAPRHSWLGCWGVCVFVRAPRLYPAFPGWGVLCGCACWALVSAVPRPSWLGCLGVYAAVRVPRLPPPFLGDGLWRGGVRVLPLVGFAPPPPSPLVFFFFFRGGHRDMSCHGFVVLVAVCLGLGSRGLCPPIPSLPGCVVLFFFPSQPGVCPRVLGVPSPVGLLLPAWCCRFRLGGLAVPLWGVLSSVPSGWGVRPPLAVLVGGLVALGRSCPPPPPVFFWGGSACSSLCLPWAGARIGRLSVWSSGLLLVVAFCQAVPRPHGSGGLCTRWARRPLLPGQVVALPAGRLRQAASCGPGLGGLGFTVSFRLRSAGFNFLAAVCVGGPPTLLPGVRWPLARVWRGGAVPSGVCGGLFWLDPRLASLALVLWCAAVRRVAPCRAVVCRSVPRRVASCCGVLCFGVPRCGVLHCGALPCGVPCCLVLCRVR